MFDPSDFVVSAANPISDRFEPDPTPDISMADADKSYRECAERPDFIDVGLIEGATAAFNGLLLRFALTGEGAVPAGPTLGGAPGTVRLPAGTYRIDGVELAAGQRLVGVSRTRSRLRLAHGVAIQVGQGSHGVHLARLGIEANAPHNGVGVQCEGADRLTIEDVDFEELAVGVRVRRAGRASRMIVIEGCAFAACRWGVSAPVADSVTLLRVLGCAFSVDRADIEGGGIQVRGQSLSVSACRFEGVGIGGPARWRPIDIAAVGAEVRYNLFDAPTPHIVSTPLSKGEDGVLIEHNVHLQGDQDDAVRREHDTGVNRGPGLGRVGSGEGLYNLLSNGSFEWWDETDCGPMPVGWRLEGDAARLQRLEHGGPRSADAPRMYTRGIADPHVRDGNHALRVTAPPSHRLCVRAAPVELPYGGPLTFACWVRVGRLPADADAPLVRLTASAGSCTTSEPLRVGPRSVRTWQRLACTIIADKAQRSISLGIDVVAPAGKDSLVVDLDGATLHRGYFAMEAAPRAIADAGGEILGPVRYAGRGALMTAHVRVVTKGGFGVEAIAVPTACVVEQLSATGVGRFTLDAGVVELGARLPRAERVAGGPVLEVAPAWRVNPGEVLRIQVSRAEPAVVDVALRFRVPAHAIRSRMQPPWSV